MNESFYILFNDLHSILYKLKILKQKPYLDKTTDGYSVLLYGLSKAKQHKNIHIGYSYVLNTSTDNVTTFYTLTGINQTNWYALKLTC